MTPRWPFRFSASARQRGAAIILAMLVVMMATVLAAYMAQQQDLWQQQVENQFNWVQARNVSIAAIDWARAVLADDAVANNYDHPGELWTRPMPAATVEEGEVVGTIEDRQGLFNLNNLVRNGMASEPDVSRFQRLLMLLDLPPDLAYSLVDWMDTDCAPENAAGAEDAYYLSLPQPYRAANRQLVELDELLLVKGFDAATVSRLRPYVAVLPGPTPVNVNFAPPEVLVAMIDGLQISMARQLVQERTEQPFTSVADFNSRLPSHLRIPEGMATVSTQYFMVRGHVTYAHSQVVMDVLLSRSGPKSTVIWQNIE